MSKRRNPRASSVLIPFVAAGAALAVYYWFKKTTQMPVVVPPPIPQRSPDSNGLPAQVQNVIQDLFDSAEVSL